MLTSLLSLCLNLIILTVCLKQSIYFSLFGVHEVKSLKREYPESFAPLSWTVFVFRRSGNPFTDFNLGEIKLEIQRPVNF